MKIINPIQSNPIYLNQATRPTVTHYTLLINQQVHLLGISIVLTAAVCQRLLLHK